MQKQIQSSAKRGFFSKRSVGPQVREKFTLEDMLCFQKVLAPFDYHVVVCFKWKSLLLLLHDCYCL